MLLNEIFKNAPEMDIKQLSCDSRVPMKDCIYFCIKGIKYDGHDFIDEAIDNGANVIVYSDDILSTKGAIFIRVNNVDDVLNRVSNKFYNYPSNKLETYIVSGTEGRSSVSYIIDSLLTPYKKCSSIGVFGIKYDETKLSSFNPTLPILDNQKYFDEFVKQGCKVCTLEATALSLAYKKLDMVKPNAFIYTTTNVEDTEYYEMKNKYFDSIKRYLYTLDDNSIIVLNHDDISYDELIKASSINRITYGTNSDSDVVISDIYVYNNNTSFILKIENKQYVVNTSLLGLANVYNLTAAICTLYKMGYKLDDLIYHANNIPPLAGVVERLKFDNFNIYVDCANNIKSYKRILSFAKRIKLSNSKIISIVSVNTSDTKNKLSEIAKILDSTSNNVILTSDDVYEGDINDNLNFINKRLNNVNSIIVEDREEAIEEGVELMNSNDILLILGKGNEDYMYRGLVKKSYAGDKENAYKYMNKRLKEEALILDI